MVMMTIISVRGMIPTNNNNDIYIYGVTIRIRIVTVGRNSNHVNKNGQ